MLSAVIRNGHSYRTMPLAEQFVHHRSAHPGPLVLGATPLNSPARTLDRDRTVSQRSEPSSRTALMGEQPNPWEVLPPQDATSRHRANLRRYRRCRLSLHPARVMSEGPAFDGDHRVASAEADLPSHHSQCESGSVVTGSCRFVVGRLPTVLSSLEESTVISRFL
jgi:hypothetical protein